eukprot:XP_014778702.1 PREDICTED: uncharacterized protein LOC106875178 [Octopus bimaculoides]
MAEYSNATDKEWGPQYDNLAYQPELVSRLQRTWPNSQKQTLFSGESNNDWDNMPPDYSPNTRNCKRFLVIFGVLLLIIGVAAGIVVAIYFSSQGSSHLIVNVDNCSFLVLKEALSWATASNSPLHQNATFETVSVAQVMLQHNYNLELKLRPQNLRP